MAHPLIRKLEGLVPLTEAECGALLEAIGPTLRFGAREAIVTGQEPAGGINLILDGIACGYKILPDGRRQILAYFVPGDMCDLGTFLSEGIARPIASLAPVSVAVMARETMLRLAEAYPRIARALWRATLAEEAITREWLVNLGQRTAFERLAHFLCEMLLRLQAVDLADGNQCELPMTQAELADTLGLSTVHINRTLQELRRANLITLRGKSLVVHDLAALQGVALFDPGYLRPGEGRTRAADAR